MASRRETRLTYGGDPLEGVDTQLSQFDLAELLQAIGQSIAAQASIVHGAPANIFPPSLNSLTETDYAFESCKAFYEATVEAARSLPALGYSGPIKQSKPTDADAPSTLDEEHDYGGSGGSANIPAITASRSPSQGIPQMEILTGESERSAVSKSKEVPQTDSIDSGLDGDLASSAPRRTTHNPTSPSILTSFLRPMNSSEQSSPALNLTHSDGGGDGSPNLTKTSSALSSTELPSARAWEFENHTRHQRNISKATSNEPSPGHIPQASLADSSTSPRKQSVTPCPSLTRSQSDLVHSQSDLVPFESEVVLSQSDLVHSQSDLVHSQSDSARSMGILEPGTRSMQQSAFDVVTVPVEEEVHSCEEVTPLLDIPRSRQSSDVGSIYFGVNGEAMALEVARRLVKFSTGTFESARPLGTGTATTRTDDNSSTLHKYRSYLESHVDAGHLIPMDYRRLIPEVLPPGYINITYLQSPTEKRNMQIQHLAHRLSPLLTVDDVAQLAQYGHLQNVLNFVKRAWPMFPRPFRFRPLSTSSNAPPICLPRTNADTWRYDIPQEVLVYMATRYLSYADIRGLRLVNKSMSACFSPVCFRSLVIRFGSDMFTPSQRYCEFVNKFAISFEVDLASLSKAKNKVSQEMREAFWGNYAWPKAAYQRFPELKALEDLVDENESLLKKTLENLPIASELALSVDSGHGWLNGSDLSDMQLWEIRHSGSKVFGKTFTAVDKWQEHLRNEIFLWAQKNTIIQSTKYLVERSSVEGTNAFNRTRSKLRWLRNVRCRHFNSFELVSNQPAQDPNHHTGGTPPPTPANANPLAANNLQFPGPAPAATAGLGLGALNPQLQLQPVAQPLNGMGLGAPGLALPRPGQRTQSGSRPPSKKSRDQRAVQWPLIFSGYNVAAELGGQNSYIQDKIADPESSFLQPGYLTEAQAQYLMETVWAQRAFLSAYTTSVILNKANLRRVHALNIAKLSSGLLPSLEQDEFWRALPFLRILTILISPDWRQEHMPGDKFFQSNMLISPIKASTQLTNFLQRFICNLENLSKLTIGFVGGGEHAPGMMARNQHVLPAPVTQQPRAWLSDHITTPSPQSMISFIHIEDLKFVNCWFSPCMLLAFMEKSRDTSLRHLTLDSVSLTAHGASSVPITGPMKPISAQYGAGSWLNEKLPNKGCWPYVLDEITPGLTFLEQKDALGIYMSEEDEQRLLLKSFRGNVQEITLNSCGYALISGVMIPELNQSSLLRGQFGALDNGLAARKGILQMGQQAPRSRRPQPAPAANANPQPIPSIDSRPSTPQNIDGRLMMGTNDAHGYEYFGLGTLTQAVHPVEKRVLEQGWNMRFGWGDDMNRWSAVDDGFYEGGTGRFSGKVLK